MKIGIAGPIDLASLSDVVDSESSTGITGLGGTPVTALVRALVAMGHEVEVFTLDRAVEIGLIIQGKNLVVNVGRYRRTGRGRDCFRSEREALLDQMRKSSVEIVHAHWTYEFAMAALASGKPCLVTAHDSPLRVLRYDWSPYRVVRTSMAWRVLRSRPHLTAVSPSTARHIKSVFGYDAEVSIIPNPLPAYLFDLQPQDPDPSSRLVFGSVINGWGALKNPKVALRAFGLVRSRFPHAKLRMYGKDYGVGEVANRWAQAEGLAMGVDFVGYVAPLELHAALASDVDILLHPAREESFGMVLAEALALGIPVIAGDRSGGGPWVLGDAGMLVDVTNETLVAEAMVRLATDANLRRRLTDAGRRRSAMFEPRTVASMYIEQYESVLQEEAIR